MDNYLLGDAHRVIAEIIKGKQAVSNYDGVREKWGTSAALHITVLFAVRVLIRLKS